MKSTILNPRRLATLILLPVALMLQVACRDTTAPRAFLPTATTSVTLYALNGTSAGVPSAYSVASNRAVHMDGALFFDLVFDIDDQGRALFYQLELIAWPRVGIHRVGLLLTGQDFDDVTRAATGGYQYSEPQIVQVGDVVVVESQDERICSFPFSPRLYAKVAVEAVDPVTRTVRLRVTQNPNCGFRSFLEGIPVD
jgi:hypothetical protein